jgi:chloramphenicol 3-O phosphotransferase
VVDVGHHDAYSRPLGVLRDAARRLEGLPAWLVGVRCAVETVMQRRRAAQSEREGEYVAGASTGPLPDPVVDWQREVHIPGVYDLEVDTTTMSPADCARLIRRRLDTGDPPTAFGRLRGET